MGGRTVVLDSGVEVGSGAFVAVDRIVVFDGATVVVGS